MKALFEYIKLRITTRIPSLKVELFNDQFNKANLERNEKAIIYPICYVEFITEGVNNLPLGIDDYTLRVRFRIGVEGYKYQRPETFDFIDQFLAAVNRMRPPVPDGGLYFTSFQLLPPEFDEDHDNVERPYLDFRTRFRRQTSYTALTPKDPPTALDLEIDVVENIE